MLIARSKSLRFPSENSLFTLRGLALRHYGGKGKRASTARVFVGISTRAEMMFQTTCVRRDVFGRGRNSSALFDGTTHLFFF